METGARQLIDIAFPTIPSTFFPDVSRFLESQSRCARLLDNSITGSSPVGGKRRTRAAVFD